MRIVRDEVAPWQIGCSGMAFEQHLAINDAVDDKIKSLRITDGAVFWLDVVLLRTSLSQSDLVSPIW